MILVFLVIWLFHVQPLWTWICHHVLFTLFVLAVLL